jgi:hypothetical protein
LLNFTVGCESPSTQVPLQWSKEIKITLRQFREVGDEFQLVMCLLVADI